MYAAYAHLGGQVIYLLLGQVAQRQNYCFQLIRRKPTEKIGLIFLRINSLPKLKEKFPAVTQKRNKLLAKAILITLLKS